MDILKQAVTSAAAPVAESPADSGYERTRTLRNATILMVDDEPTTLDIVEIYLEDAGYGHLITTTDSSAAVDLIRNKRPDAVLLDIMMPKVDGFEILSRLRADPELKHTPVIVLSSSTDGVTKLRALELGATDMLSKPVDSSELILRLRNTLAAKAYLDRLANYDELTGLPNRRMFTERLQRALERVDRDGKTSAVVHIGLDRFRQVNEALGQRLGDVLLTMVANRLDQCVRGWDIISVPETSDIMVSGLSRVGGDEFSVLLTMIDTVDDVARAARRIQQSLAEPFRLRDEDLYITASAGVAVFPADGTDIETLQGNAAVALSHAKQLGRNNCQFFAEALNERSASRLMLESRLHKAIDNDELLLHFQPKVDVATGAIAGAEALVRWERPDEGLVSPGEFIPLAEESGLIVPIGDWVLEETCRALVRWRERGIDNLRVSINVSSRQFWSGDLLDKVSDALARYELPGSCLALEITETVLMQNPDMCSNVLVSLKYLGVTVSIDDFGTGYSSLSYLRRFPLDELKVDRAFIKDLPADKDGIAIVSAVVAMAHALSLKVVAEGVETEEQLEFLKTRQCNQYQGFYFSRPLPENDFVALVDKSAGND